MPPNDPMTPQRLLQKALANIDWGQVVANGGPPCFHIEDGRFCLRAERWDGHRAVGFHSYLSLEAAWSGQLERNADLLAVVKAAQESVKNCPTCNDRFVMGPIVFGNAQWLPCPNCTALHSALAKMEEK